MRGFRGVTAAMIDLGRLSESAMNLRTAPAMDKATFRRWLEHQERRFELVEGRPRVLPHFAMTHARICGKLFTMLTARIDLDRFDITLADFAVGTGPASIRFPDVFGLSASSRWPSSRNIGRARPHRGAFSIDRRRRFRSQA
jgi:hypothetical protein